MRKTACYTGIVAAVTIVGAAWWLVATPARLGAG
jgi:hypothetical protein